MNLEIKNKENPFNDFKRIALHLMNNNVLIVGHGRYRFTELEFYYFNENGKHADVYSHRHRYQKTNGQWYFHGSGLDITFGSENVYGGILIRGIKNLQDNKFINGPILCVQELFENLGGVNNEEKVNFYIQELPWEGMNSVIEIQEIYSCRRVRINQEIDIPNDLRFYNSFYRFFIYPKQKHDDKSNIATDLLAQKLHTKSEINDLLFGYKHFK
jgi:hypothetical protein